MRIITAIGNPKLNNDLKILTNFEIIAPDIQYQDGVLELLEEKSNIDYLILSEILPGNYDTCNFIKLIKELNNRINIIFILENKKEYLEKFLFSKGVFYLFYNNEVSINEIINIIQKENIEENFNNVNLENNKYLLNKKNECKVFCVTGLPESGKSIFCLNLIKNLKNKKILLIDFDINNNSIIYFLVTKKHINKKENNFKYNIYKFNNNLHIINGNDFFENNKISNSSIKKLISELKNNYDYILIDTSSEYYYDLNKYLIKNSNECIFLLEANLLEIKKSKKILNYYLEEWCINKDKINIIFNKCNKNSIDIDLLKYIFYNFKIIGNLDYDDNYNLLINKKFKNYFMCNKIKKQYNKIINDFIINNLFNYKKTNKFKIINGGNKSE